MAISHAVSLRNTFATNVISDVDGGGGGSARRAEDGVVGRVGEHRRLPDGEVAQRANFGTDTGHGQRGVRPGAVAHIVVAMQHT